MSLTTRTWRKATLTLELLAARAEGAQRRNDPAELERAALAMSQMKRALVRKAGGGQ